MRKPFLYFFLIACLLSQIAAAQQPSENDYQEVPFKPIGHPIGDTMNFIKQLKDNCHLSPDDGGHTEWEKITRLLRFKIYDSNEEYFLVEFNWKYGCNASYPWKYQIVFDTKGRLIKVLSDIKFSFIKIFSNEHPFLVSVSSTARGNGNHNVYKMENGKLINVLIYPNEFCLNTYQQAYSAVVNEPYGLNLKIADINRDGYNDLVFSGKLKITNGISKDNIWYDCENSSRCYSEDDPFVRIPIKIYFVYDLQTKTFRLKGDYHKYCEENLYKLIYHLPK